MAWGKLDTRGCVGGAGGGAVFGCPVSSFIVSGAVGFRVASSIAPCFTTPENMRMNDFSWDSDDIFE